MKKIASVVLFLGVCLLAAAQKIDYSAAFEYVFADYEYQASESCFDRSHTLHALRLSPEVGLTVAQSPAVFHRVNVGVDIFKQMGEGVQNAGLFQEVLAYYNIEARLRNGGSISGYAGVFPRRYGNRSACLFSLYDSEMLYLDPNVEGLMFSYNVPGRLESEFILDWQGMFGNRSDLSRREIIRFMGVGSWCFADRLSLGWAASFLHHASSPLRKNIVDVITLNPRLEWEPRTALDVFRLELGALVSYQCDRVVSMDPVFPAGVLARQAAGKWGLRLDNRFYWGADQAPFYDRAYIGEEYARNVYYCEPGFRMPEQTGWADWLSVVYSPNLSRVLKLELALTAQFGPPSEQLYIYTFRGWRPTFRLSLDLDALRPRPQRPQPLRGYNM
ncbi:MAG: hypothetical protein IKZ91_04755 [Bacteroidales bacterium]|nr:hypothetical protein [Bacteroidales bacterium]